MAEIDLKIGDRVRLLGHVEKGTAYGWQVCNGQGTLWPLVESEPLRAYAAGKLTQVVYRVLDRFDYLPNPTRPPYLFVGWSWRSLGPLVWNGDPDWPGELKVIDRVRVGMVVPTTGTAYRQPIATLPEQIELLQD